MLGERISYLVDTVGGAASGRGPVDDVNPARGDVCHGVGRGGDGAGSGFSIILGNQPGNNFSIRGRIRINYRVSHQVGYCILLTSNSLFRGPPNSGWQLQIWQNWLGM